MTPQDFAHQLTMESLGRDEPPGPGAPYAGKPRKLYESELLTERERMVLLMRRKGHTLQAVGAFMGGLRRERVRQIQLLAARRWTYLYGQPPMLDPLKVRASDWLREIREQDGYEAERLPRLSNGHAQWCTEMTMAGRSCDCSPTLESEHQDRERARAAGLSEAGKVLEPCPECGLYMCSCSVDPHEGET